MELLDSSLTHGTNHLDNLLLQQLRAALQEATSLRCLACRDSEALRLHVFDLEKRNAALQSQLRALMTSPDDVSDDAALAAAQEVWQRACDFARAENEADLRRAESRFAEVLKAEQGERDRLVLETVQVDRHMLVLSS
jgi:hypothetical protein